MAVPIFAILTDVHDTDDRNCHEHSFIKQYKHIQYIYKGRLYADLCSVGDRDTDVHSKPYNL